MAALAELGAGLLAMGASIVLLVALWAEDQRLLGMGSALAWAGFAAMLWSLAAEPFVDRPVPYLIISLLALLGLGCCAVYGGIVVLMGPRGTHALGWVAPLVLGLGLAAHMAFLTGASGHLQPTTPERFAEP